MEIQQFKTAAQQAKDLVVNKGSVYANWAGKQITHISGVLKETATVVMNWIKGVFKNFPQYFDATKQYVKFGIEYVRNHQYPVAVGAGIASLAAIVIYGLAKFLGGE